MTITDIYVKLDSYENLRRINSKKWFEKKSCVAYLRIFGKLLCLYNKRSKEQIGDKFRKIFDKKLK